jgi:hypothetical protein
MTQRQQELERLKHAVRSDGIVPTCAELRLVGLYAHSPGVPACPEAGCKAREGQLCDTQTGWCFQRRTALAATWTGAVAP